VGPHEREPVKKRTPPEGLAAASRPVGDPATEIAVPWLPLPASAHPVPVPGDDRHSTFPEQGAYTVRVTGRSFCCGVAIRDGRITNDGTAPYLQRMRGMTLAALMVQAAEKDWTVERIKSK
jgi:hypothetical protein